MNIVRFDGKNRWTVVKNGQMLCSGTKNNIEDFLDHDENLHRERKRQERIKRRLAKLMNWLYNNKKKG